jgi:uncharacterized protein YaiI (UPF0178 family)
MKGSLQKEELEIYSRNKIQQNINTRYLNHNARIGGAKTRGK